MNVRVPAFALTPKGESSYHRSGKAIVLTTGSANIGESADCDVRYPAGDLSPEYYASIIRDAERQRWLLVRRSQHVGISIDGKGDIGYACGLGSGDVIRFEGQQMALLFQEHVKRDAWRVRLWALLTIACGLLLLAGLWALAGRRSDPIGIDDVTPLEASLYIIKADSVKQLLTARGEDTLLRPTKVLTAEAPTGTAFMTTDGVLVTARHCVEYWIGTALNLTQRFSRLADDDIVKWAIEAETFNQAQHTDSTMQLRVYFSIYDFMGEPKYTFSTADPRVHINTAHDGIFQLADFNSDYYWRTIRPYFQDSQMELGDIMWIDGFEEKGQIALATGADFDALAKGSRLMICGYPITNASTRQATFSEGVIKHEPQPAAENLVFESNINHGFSGGPVLTKTSGAIVAVGVVSRVDSVSSGIFKHAVPTSEIKIKEGGQDYD